MNSNDLKQITQIINQALANVATKNDLKKFASKDDLQQFATKQDLKRYPTKNDLDDAVAQIIEIVDKHKADKSMSKGLKFA